MWPLAACEAPISEPASSARRWAATVDLTGMRPGLDQRRFEGCRGAQHGLQAHGADDVRGGGQPPRVLEGQGSQRAHQLGAVQQRQALLRLQRQRPQPGVGQGFGRRARSALVDPGLSLADHHQREVGQRRQVAGRTDAAARGHHGMHLVVEHADQQLHHLGAHAGQANRQGVGAQQQHGPHHLGGERLAHAGGVRPHQVALQLGGLGGLDPDVRQVPEAGGDAVGGASVGDQLLDHRPRGAHPLHRRRVQLHLTARTGDLRHVPGGQRGAAEAQGGMGGGLRGRLLQRVPRCARRRDSQGAGARSGPSANLYYERATPAGPHESPARGRRRQKPPRRRRPEPGRGFPAGPDHPADPLLAGHAQAHHGLHAAGAVAHEPGGAAGARVDGVHPAILSHA